ncbi:MAG: hypothetical protein JSR37_00170 [Verrucomicrobia bacterium]|nr:hypothetical protein [Verrucomicrobiota bacterium]MBS0636199.1 hypothetical protein [Verrucomicrobiota bacterium]
MKNLFGLFRALMLLISIQAPIFAKHHSSSSSANAYGYWQPLVNQPTFLQGGAATPILLTDGSILITDIGYSDIWRLVPDETGDYANGRWIQAASLPAIPQNIDWPIQYSCRTAPNEPNQTEYAPAYFASAVLADGRVVFAGGENNGPNFDFVLTNMCAIYDPVEDLWQPILPPPFVIDQYPPRAEFAPNAIGDASSVVLEDGTFVLAPKMSNQLAYLNPKTLKWTEVGTRTNPSMNDEQFLVLLPNGNVLTTECYNGQYFVPEIYGSFPLSANMTNSLIFNPKTKRWKSAGSTIQPLTEEIAGEIGPAILRPDGKVVAFGGSYTGQNVLFDSETETWSVTRPFPIGPGEEGQLTCADACAVLLPNGNVFVVAGPFFFLPPAHFFEFTYENNELIEQAVMPNSQDIVSSAPNMVLLPTGQVLVTSETSSVYIYTPGNRCYNSDWAPVIKQYPEKVRKGKTYKIEGIRFNGMSQAQSYGDEDGAATNYPLVRITNDETGHVFYCRTHDHSFMGVASDKEVYTYFDVPDSIEHGKSKIEVVANGIPSKPKYIYVK